MSPVTWLAQRRFLSLRLPNAVRVTHRSRCLRSFRWRLRYELLKACLPPVIPSEARNLLLAFLENATVIEKQILRPETGLRMTCHEARVAQHRSRSLQSVRTESSLNPPRDEVDSPLQSSSSGATIFPRHVFGAGKPDRTFWQRHRARICLTNEGYCASLGCAGRSG
jgi:hypothetical protein